MALLNRVAGSNIDPQRAITALRLINQCRAGELSQGLAYAKDNISHDDLWVRLHWVESQQKVLSQTMFEVAAKPMAVSPEADSYPPGVIPDVIEEQAIQERLQQERLAAVEQLTRGIAHHFSNILQGIIGSAEVALLDLNNPSFVARYLEQIVKQGLEAAQLVRQLLEFSDQSIPEKRVADLASLVKQGVEILKRTLPEDIYLTLTIEPACEAYLLNADPTQIQQVLTNLVFNARDAMPAGGGLQIQLSRLTVEPPEQIVLPELPSGNEQSSLVDWLVLSVSDTGTGIAPEVLPHIFEPFFTTKKVGQGAGLGLAQVYGIVEQHGGHIEVASQMGQGTSFSLYLPAWPVLLKSSPQLAQVEASCEYALLDYC